MEISKSEELQMNLLYTRERELVSSKRDAASANDNEDVEYYQKKIKLVRQEIESLEKDIQEARKGRAENAN